MIVLHNVCYIMCVTYCGDYMHDRLYIENEEH